MLTDTIDHYRPVIMTANDYYPFGMLMPGRNSEDTNTHVADITAVKNVGIHHPLTRAWGAVAAGSSPFGGSSQSISISPPPTGLTTHGPVGSGYEYTLPYTVPGYLHTITVNISPMAGAGPYTLEIVQGGSTLASVSFGSGAVIISYMPGTGTVKLRVENTGFGTANSFKINSVIIDSVTLATQTVVTQIASDDEYHYGYNGQYKDNEWAGKGNHNTALFWEYGTREGKRKNKDEWNNNPSISPYAVFDNNPIWKSDVLGNTASTDVTKEKDGTYKVAGGKDDGDKNIYVVGGDGKRTGEVVGQSVTPNSFLGDNGKAVMGAVINPNDNSGANFLNNEIIGQGLGLGDYMKNGGNGGIYDFKVRGMDKEGSKDYKEQYKYRGMPVDGVKGLGGGGKTFASGRDIGNVGAGYIAGSHGMSWGDARLGFDAYQSKKSGGLTTEGKPTQAAERVGFGLGESQWQRQHPVIKLFRSQDVYHSFPPK